MKQCLHLLRLLFVLNEEVKTENPRLQALWVRCNQFDVSELLQSYRKRIEGAISALGTINLRSLVEDSQFCQLSDTLMLLIFAIWFQNLIFLVN